MKSGKEDKVKEYDIMRVLLTIMIVTYHALYLSMPFAFGGVDYTSPGSLGNCMVTGVYRLLGKITAFFGYFQMPAFFFLSGAVFCLGMGQKKYPDLEKLVLNKAKRLLYPGLTAGIFWMVPLKSLGNGYASAKILPYAVLQGVVLCQGGLGHLWYLFTLFWIFVAGYLCLRYLIKERWYVLAISLFMLGTFYGVFEISLPGAVSPAYYLLFFFVGYSFEKVREKLMGHMVLSAAAALTGVVIAYHFTSAGVTTGLFWEDWLKTLGICACAVLVFVLSHLLAKINMTGLGLYKLLEKHSFYIYLLHDPLNYVMLAAAAAATGKIGEKYSINWSAVGFLLPSLRIFGNIALCIIVSAVLRKIKFARTGWFLLAAVVISMTVILYDKL